MKKETHGKVLQITGRAKEAVGIVTGNATLEKEGARQRVAGTVEKKVGMAKRKVGEAVARITGTTPN
jgi:uncharacterized protein YjbJ (UPF0337 family)